MNISDRHKLKEGQIVIYNCPFYRVKNCRAEVVILNRVATAIRPLDGQTFDHDNFESNGVHFPIINDTWEVVGYNGKHLPEDLFEI